MTRHLARLLLLLPALTACEPPTDTDAVKPDTDDPAETGETGGPDNRAPTAPDVVLTPDAPNTLSDLTATLVAASTDPDGDAVTYRYAWSVDGAARADLTGNAVSAELTEDGQTWEVTVTPTDGALDGPADTAAVTVGNTPPTAPEIHLEPAAPQPKETLTLVVDTEASDANGDALTQTIEWYVNGSRNGSWSGATSVDGRYVDGGETYRVVVGVTDGLSDPVTVEATVTVANTPPEITSARISPSQAKDDDALTVSVVADDADGNSLTYAYRWYRDGVEATDVGDSDTVPAGATAVGEAWTCTVTVSDGTATDEATTDAVTIASWFGYTYTHTVELTVGEDTAGNTVTEGTWSLDYESNSTWRGEHACSVWWAVTGTEGRCRGCTYAFDTELTYDSSLSSIVTGCGDLQQDGTGTATWTEPWRGFYSYVSGPGMGSYYGSYMWLFVYGSGGWSYSYGGYTYGTYYDASSSVDTAGNTVISVSQQYFLYY